MNAIVKLYSTKSGEILKFLQHFSKDISSIDDDLLWQKNYENPIEIADIISALLENNYDINMWISLDKDVFINVTDHNADDIIRYLFERYPY